MQTYEPHKWSPPKRCHTGRFLLRPVYDARADPAWYADKGGVYQDSVMRYTSTIVPYLIAMPLLDSDNPASPCRTSGKGQDGSDPPLICRLCGKRGQGFVTIPPVPPFGVAPVQFISAGRLQTRTTSGRCRAAGKPHGMALSDPDLCRACAALHGVSSTGLSPCPATIQCSTWCSITPPTSTPGSSGGTTSRRPPPSSSAAWFLSRSGGSGFRPGGSVCRTSEYCLYGP